MHSKIPTGPDCTMKFLLRNPFNELFGFNLVYLRIALFNLASGVTTALFALANGLAIALIGLVAVSIIVTQDVS